MTPAANVVAREANVDADELARAAATADCWAWSLQAAQFGATKLWPWAGSKIRIKFQIWTCFLTTLFRKKSFQKRLHKKRLKFEFEFQIFVQRQVWVMGFQELCLLCYGTQRLRHNQVGRVAKSPLWQGVQLVPISWCPCTRFRQTRLSATIYGRVV